MFKHYLKTAFRHFSRHKLTAAINVLGLSVGISAALVIFIIVKYDYSFDKYQPDNDRIYRVVTDGDGWKNSGVPVPFVQAFKQNSGGVSAIAPIFDYGWNTPVSIPEGSNKVDKLFKNQQGIVFTDAGYFDIFPYTWIAGNASSALKQPYGLVLSDERAKLYFPDVAPEHLVGRTVIFNDTVKTTITGIVAANKALSDFKYDAFVSLSTVYNTGLKTYYQTDVWGSTNSSNQIFVKLAPNVSEARINKQIANIFDRFGEKNNNGIKTIHRLQALSNIHTNPSYDGQVNPETLRNLTILAIFLLALGAINFVNLSTAQASERAKDIGIRKTLGSLKTQLIAQFLTETFLLTTFTAIVSLALLPLLLMVFGSFIPEGLTAVYILREPMVWVFLLLLIITVSLIAGLYPAFVLTRFKPVSVLKNTVVSSSGASRSSWLRSTLIVSQFVIAQVFVIAVMVVNKQVQFAMQKDMGFRKNAVINFIIPRNFAKPDDKGFILKNKLNALPGVEAVSLGNQTPAFAGSMETSISYKEKGKDVTLSVASRNGDTSYLKVYQIPLIAGRNIVASDTANELLINETLAKQLGFMQPAKAVGHTLDFGGPKPIVGVMRDFNQASVRRAVAPLVYFAAPKFGYVMHIALVADHTTWQKTIAQIQSAWKGVYPDVDFEYHFLDEKMENFYQNERQLSSLLTWSAGVSILISCLGMLGLVIFMTNKRVKEIGIRRVLGATITEIVTLLSADFAKLLLLAFAIAAPIAWWQMNKWLQSFAYHAPLSWWLFLLSGLLMVTIALIIVGLRAGKAALANPVQSLRTD
ncbi:ABC transporter permease [Mucilaginibacter auburnensis]|uniref:ABC-type antimicrobial peptide transport system permease subunit n=1 Tax=Mucilaginibacter auburnensis TaxID=1457233 RepID=A0A2H9VN57_9SPHI|nr:ABC transporter permease [Mucilaginibacter auburnensis]PJJ79750.1 ABC-type antimicrobial peptide transport system permease subunit [Mucilaginibacter auburnensis]